MLQSKEQVGKLDRKIIFQRKSTALDVANANSENGWTNVASPWAKVEFGEGAEIVVAGQVKNVQDIRCTIRHRTVNAAWRISFDGNYYEIDGVKPLDRNRFLKVTGFLREDYAG